MRPADTTGSRSGVINDALDQFKAAIRSAGITPPEVIEPGRIQRFPGAGKRNSNTAGWCKLFDDGLGGCFGDWSSGFSGNWQAKRDKPLTATELGAFKRHVAEAQAQAEAERKAKQAEAATKAASIWRTARPARGDHPYLARKRVSPVASLREIDAAEAAEMLDYAPKSRGEPLAGRLLVVVKVAGELSTAELIDETGRKSALRGGAKAGGYWAAQPLEPSRSAGVAMLRLIVCPMASARA